ncbi:hypothetical protein DM860_005153 [Cuscuta australis]|uniref:DNA repair protein UVH3 n=1 Tax=Cuscuta australis TaxID=267555 RepID=A0A328DMP3_9ASTE|nr:hypothetical protein DM860_005153 [Cuscuta australis]
MGVHGLWELLAPVGRRVSVETLVGKRLAIDASIWMIQFMKAMREEKGDMVRNAHLLGFFRRICKLLYLRTKPVFVFDGGTPALKRRTVIARRRQRENAQAKIRKTAEKLLLNHLKAMRLKELSADLDNQRKKNDSKGKSVVGKEMDTVQEISGNKVSANIEKQHNMTDTKGKNVVCEESDALKNTPRSNGFASDSYINQKEVDEMLAASMAAEEDESFFPNASTSGAGDDSDEDEKMILPEMHGKIDPSVLASLPPSMQLDLLVQMRERLMAANRQKYQKVKKAPEKFSELQIQAYLKTVAFRREIDEVQKSASGKGIGGVKISRIASEANREFIFSSSFTGNKQVLTSAGENQNKNELFETRSSNNSATMVNDIAVQKSSVALESFLSEPEGITHDDVETYLDERGRLRVSRVRAMGIRMTRDLQRNLDLMKEIEKEKVVQNEDACNLPTFSTVSSNATTAHEEIQNLNDSDTDHGMTCNEVENVASLLKSGTSLEISFEEKKEHNRGGDDDDLFASLVGGNPILDFSVSNSLAEKQSVDYTSDVEWEEGDTLEKFGMLSSDFPGGNEIALSDGVLNDESEVEWEEGSLDMHKGGLSCPSGGRNGSKGHLDEEADFQEAIRRSLQDLKQRRSVEESSTSDAFKRVNGEGTMETITELDWRGKNCSNDKSSELEVLHQPEGLSKSVRYLKTNNAIDRVETIEVDNSSNTQLGPKCRDNQTQGMISNWKAHSDIADTNNCLKTQPKRPVIDNLVQGEILTRRIDAESELQDLGGSGNLKPKLTVESGTDVEETGEHMIEVQTLKTIPEVVNESCSYSGVSNMFASPSPRSPNLNISCAQEKRFQAVSDHIGNFEAGKTSLPISDTCSAQRLDGEQIHDEMAGKREELLGTAVDGNIHKGHVEFAPESLEEEMIALGEERKELVDEQRRLERNAESVTSEMFAECQELLQIFGLPYIIAPMEAEAQCAYMELVDLVDGVVTDDSDAFLFGARCVYKNIFDDRKYVETYLMKDIENELGLDREKLIRMALLLGSDYTEGVSGIGIVNAIEVVNAFPGEDGLRKFREWVESPDPTILNKVDVQGGYSSSNILQPVDGEKIKQTFMNKHRNVSKNWHIPSSFPSDAVVSAYDTPQVDRSKEVFSWGKPDVSVLRKLCWEKFGWTIQKTDELITPVLREYNKHETQLRLEAFYAFNERFAKIRSARIKKAVKGMTGNHSLELFDDAAEDTPARRRKQKVKPNVNEKRTILESGSMGADSGDDEIKNAKNSSAKKPRKRKGDLLQSEGAARRSGGSEESNARQRLKRGKRSLSLQKGRKSKSSCSRSKETSSADETSSDGEQEIDIEKVEASHTRRSGRPRKIVSYADDLEDDEYNKVAKEPTERETLDGTEKESDTVQMAHDDNNNPGDQSSKDYLKLGGGFCLEEEADDTNPESGDDDTNRLENSGFSHQAHNEDEDIEIGLIDQSVASRSREEEIMMRASETENEDGLVAVNSQEISMEDALTSGGSVRSLRAMPNLRRKRKKV